MPKHAGLNYHIITDNFFTSPQLLRSLREKGIAATGTVQLNRVENAPLKPVKEMEKLERGSADVVIDDNAKIAFARWKDKKVVTVISTGKTKQYIKEKKGRVDIEQPQCIKKYNERMGRVDRLDQNIGTYIIALRSKNWWWPIFRFCIDPLCKQCISNLLIPGLEIRGGQWSMTSEFYVLTIENLLFVVKVTTHFFVTKVPLKLIVIAGERLHT